MMINMWNDFANFILNEVDDKEYKIVEVGVGKFLEISEILSSKENITLIRTDINPKDSTVIKDDITKPNMKIYENTDLIYSIRPPSELQPYLVKLANKINAQLIIKPLTNEDLNTGKVKMKLKNFKKASFYCLR